MKKTILILILALSTVSASAAQVLEGIVVRVGDRIITRTQYERRLRDLFAEIDAAGRPEQAPAARDTARKNLVNELIGGWQWSPGTFNSGVERAQFANQDFYSLGLAGPNNTDFTNLTSATRSTTSARCCWRSG